MWKKIIFFISSAIFLETVLFAQVTEKTEEGESVITTQPAEASSLGRNNIEDIDTKELDLKFEWGEPYIKNYFDLFEEVLKHTDEYSTSKLEKARKYYTIARETEKRMLRKLKSQKEKFTKINHINEKYEWQYQERKDKEKRILRSIERKDRLSAVYYLTRVINQLDAIQRKSVLNNQNYKSLLASSYKQIVVHKFNLRDYFSTIDILERYVKIAPQYADDMNVHKYLTFAYAFQEKYAKKLQSTTNESLIYYQNQKNEHFLRYIGLQYGKNSEEYQVALDEVFKESIFASKENINNFQN